MKHPIWPVCYLTALAVFTAYFALDTFVLRDAAQTDATQMNTAMFVDTTLATEESTEAETAAETAAAAESGGKHRHKQKNEQAAATEKTDASSGQSYQDDNIRITLTELYQYNTKIYVADIRVTSAEYLKTAFAEDTYGRNITETTSSIAAAHNAVLAVNGDYYGVQERGYVIRNGIVYRSTKGTGDVLCLYADGTMQVVSPDDYTAEDLAEMGVWQAFSFGPGLVEDGQITVTQNEEVGRAMASNPRTAIGMIEPGHYVFVVSDGRTDESAGLSLYELATVMQELGVTTAYNLDGGGSSTLYFNGQVINNPTSGRSIKEREVSDIVYIGT